ncbi:MAG: polysaccharide deacetylase family protein [Candidatus Berkelbacteria bacterium]|nr:polysaccharide deacetylase family protein [Candidatus Berkelbacteria bacterium]
MNTIIFASILGTVLALSNSKPVLLTFGPQKLPPSLVGQVLRHGDPSRQEIALTFDDGPGPQTEKLLAILKKENVKATFFEIGCHVADYGKMIKEMPNQGFEIESHFYFHENLSTKSLAQNQTEVAESFKSMQGMGQKLLFFRPPYMRYSTRTAEAAKEVGCAIALWDIDPRDWSGISAIAIENAVVSKIHNGAIVLLHDNHENTLIALPVIIKKIKEKGYKFVTLREMFQQK